MANNSKSKQQEHHYQELSHHEDQLLDTFSTPDGDAESDEARAYENALQESRERYRNIFENAPIGIFQCTPHGKILRANPAMARICGYESPNDLIQQAGRLLEHFCAPSEETDSFSTEIENAGGWVNSEHEFRSRADGLIHIKITARAVQDMGGVFKYIEGFFEDITDRKVVRQALLESERRYRTIFEESRDAIYITDRSGFFIDANTATSEMFGYSREELLKRSARDLYEGDIERKRLGRELKEKGFVRDYELRLKKADGMLMDCVASAARWQDDSGNILGYLGIVRDITARKNAERALMESEARYRAIVEDQTELICRFLSDGTLTFVNDAFCRYFNRSRDELLGRSSMPLIAEEDREKVKEHIRSLSPQNPFAVCEHRVRLADGEIRWQQWSDRAILNENSNIVEFQSVGRDVTERKRFEEALKQAKEEIEKRVEERTAELRENAQHLKEVNAALKVLLNQREVDRRELEESILSNIKSLVIPYIDRLKQTRLDKNQATYLSILKDHLKEIVSPFLKNLSPQYLGLTSVEVEVAGLIKEGKSTKEIADILHVSENTVLTHRYHLRSKLGIKNKKINLRSYLSSLCDQ